jgi:hypothetical protein
MHRGGLVAALLLIAACAAPDSGVGRDAAGGGPTTALPSAGGTPGTPAESFSRETQKPKPR